MSLPRKSRTPCAGDGFDVKSCDRRAKVLDGIVPRCALCMRRRERTLARIQRGEQELEDSMLGSGAVERTTKP